MRGHEYSPHDLTPKSDGFMYGKYNDASVETNEQDLLPLIRPSFSLTWTLSNSDSVMSITIF